MNQKVIDRLRKLIAHANSAKEIGNVAEAEAFAGKIQELLDNHNLSLSDIEIEEIKSTINQSATGKNAFFNWQKQFICELADMNGCEVVLRATEITLVGNEIDRILTFEIYQYFEKLGRDFAANELKVWQSTIEYRRKRKKHFHSKLYKTSFLFGFTRRLITRLKQKNLEAKAASNNGTALIFIGNKLADANKWISNNLKVKLHNAEIKGQKLKDDAYRKGVVAASSVALTHKTVE